MKTFQEYIEEVEGYYKDIKQQIIDLVPTLQEKLDKNPNDRILGKHTVKHVFQSL